MHWSFTSNVQCALFGHGSKHFVIVISEVLFKYLDKYLYHENKIRLKALTLRLSKPHVTFF